VKVDWILAGRLAGGPRPGLLDDLEEDFEQLRRLGIRLIVNLTETPHRPPVESRGFGGLHFAIPDMGIVSPRRLLPVLLQVLEHAEGGRPVLVHCKAGLGRTGMVLACCLVLRGESPESAIRQVRRVNSHFIQNAAQEDLVAGFAAYLAGIGV
jgi:atypical dual specificity phosphatase